MIQNYRLYRTPLGYDTVDQWMVNLSFRGEDSLAVVDTKERLMRELIEQPEIESASWVGPIHPFGGSIWITANDDNGFELRTNMAFADLNYAETAGLKLLEGRWFNESDEFAKYRPVVINQTLRDAYFKNTPAIFDSIYVIDGENKIIGVVENFKYQGEFSEEEPLTFFYERPYSDQLNDLKLENAPGDHLGF